MKRIYFFLAVLTQLVLLAACSEEELVPNKSGDIDGNEYTPYVIPGRPITISADIEQQGSNTRTALSGLDVVWSEGDAFSLMTRKGESIPCNLEVTLTGTSQGYGIHVDEEGTYYIKYDDISVIQNVTTTKGSSWNASPTTTQNDITNTIINNNTYRIGTYTGSYVVAAKGASLQVELNDAGTKYTIPLIQSSSSSTFSTTSGNGWNKTTTTYTYTIKMTNVKYSSDGVNWLSPTTAQLKNGSKWGKSDATVVSATGGDSQETISRFEAQIDKSGTGKTSAAFTGELKLEDATHYAVYPYSESNTISGDNITFSMPAEQQYVEGSFGNGANPAVGVLEQKDNGDYHISFLNVCGVLKLQLKGTQKIASITVKDKAGKALSGTATVACKDVTAKSVAAAEVTGSSSVVLNCADGVQLSSEPTSFYIVVPAGAFSGGFEVEARSTDGLIGTLETSKDNTIKQNTIKAMPAIELEFVEEFNVENEEVQKFMSTNTATFSSTASNYTSIDQFPLNNDVPATKTITWQSTSEAVVTLSLNADYSNPVLEARTSAGSYTLKNFVPGNIYYWCVKVGDSVLKSGKLKTTGQLRMIGLDHGFNIRDLGGWTGWSGNKVRYEQIYRGGSLGGGISYDSKQSANYVGVNEIDDEDRAELKRLGITAQLDLRAVWKSGKYTTNGETSYHSYSACQRILGDDTDFNNTQTDYGAYMQDVTLINDMAWIIYELKERNKPAYFNCRQGADRTGALGFIIECLLGCYDYNGQGGGNQVAMDYELTGFSTASRSDNLGTRAFRAAQEAYNDNNKIFNKLINNTNSCAGGKSTIMERAYYYLNQFASTQRSCFDISSHKVYDGSLSATTSRSTTNIASISQTDLDWFINYMLGITDHDGNVLAGKTKYTGPTWATNGSDLKTVAEANANKVIYAQ